MTTITYKETLEDLEIKVTGHSGYAEVGSDIVCASISTAMILSANLMEKMYSKATFLKYDEKAPSMILKLKKPLFTSRIILNNLIDFLKQLQEQYPKYVEVKEIK